MYKQEFNLLKKLTEAHGVSGFEEEVTNLIEKELNDPRFVIEKDALGSLIVRYQTDLTKALISFSAHVDEVGFVVSEITNKGFLKLKTIGGWQNYIIPSSKVIIKASNGDKFIGIIGNEAPHYANSDDYATFFDLNNIYIDIGAFSKKEVLEKGINVGNPIVPYSELEVLNDNIVVGKALDDRICATSLVLALKKLAKNDVKCNFVAIFTTQEEVGTRGAKASIAKVNSDIGFAIDVTDSFDTETSIQFPCGLGSGVALSFKDGGTIAHRGLFNYVLNLFNKNKIRNTYDPMDVGGTDSSRIHKNDIGIVNMTISLPVRYMHSPYTVGSLEDLVTLTNAIILLTKRLTKEEVSKIKEAKYKRIIK